MSPTGFVARRCLVVARNSARLPIIRGSEIGEYVLRRVAGLEPAGRERRERGTALHRRHGRDVVLSGALIWVGALLLVAAAGAMVLLR